MEGYLSADDFTNPLLESPRVRAYSLGKPMVLLQVSRPSAHLREGTWGREGGNGRSLSTLHTLSFCL
jgi:hypothetical protein